MPGMMPVRNTGLQNEEKNPPIPDPGIDVAQFISWLKKHGYTWDFLKCQKKARHLGLDLEEDILRELGKEIIRVYISRGEKVVSLLDKTWAQDISTHHGVDIPHHKHHKPW